MIYYIEANEGHLSTLVPLLREIDVEECEDIFGVTIEEGLKWSLQHSTEAYTIMNGPTPMGMFGVVAGTPVSTPWLVGSEDLTKYWMTFARESRDVWRMFDQRYGPLVNYLKKDNTVHRRWLRWLGATFEEVPKCPEIVRFKSCVSHSQQPRY